MYEEHKAAIQRMVDEVFVKGNVEVVDEVYSEDYFDHSLHHTQLWGVDPDRAGFKKLVRMATTGLSGLEAEIDLLVAEDDLVAARVLASGVHTGDFMGVPPTGKVVELSDWHYWRFDDKGLIIEHWNQYNTLEVMQQLGVIPPLPDPGSRADAEN
jgi:steroid delta-isomerase-like uncharacterized protein